MTLNFSHHPILPLPNPSIRSFIHEKGGDVFGGPCYIDAANNVSYSYGQDRGGANNAGSDEPIGTDIADLLPSDPFGMNLDSTLKAAITVWIEDITENYTNDQRRVIHSNHVSGSNYSYDSSVWYIWEHGLPHLHLSGFVDKGFPELLDSSPKIGAIGMPSYSRYELLRSDCAGESWPVNPQSQCQINVKERSMVGGEIFVTQITDFLPEEAGQYAGGSHCGIESEHDIEPLSKGLSFVRNDGGAESGDNQFLAEGMLFEGNHDVGESIDGEPPHEGLLFALRYLELRDLLSIERVCKRLCYAVQTDPLLWRCLHIDQPLSARLTDDALFQLARRAEGRLQCLDLVKCVGITDTGLKRVIESNPGISKLSIPGCARLTLDGVINTLKFFKTPSIPCMKHVRVGGIYGTTPAHYKELKKLVGMDKCEQQQAQRPQFYHVGFSMPPCEYELPIDIEMCPKCQDLRLVYDCPAERCQQKASSPCRGCIICIPRCVSCGACITDYEYEETFCLDKVCMGCYKHHIHCEKEQSPLGENTTRKIAFLEELVQVES